MLPYAEKFLGGGGLSRLGFALATFLAFLTFLTPSFAFASDLPDIFDPDVIAFTEVVSHPVSASTFGFDQEGRLWAWGHNGYGQLGIGGTAAVHRPTLVSLLGLDGVTHFETVTTGGWHTLALDQQGRLWAWGNNGAGRLGIGGTVAQQRPTLVPLAGLISGGIAVTSFDAVVAGTSHSLALDQEGRLWAWGHNGGGRLGIGGTADAHRPTFVSLVGLEGVTSFNSVIPGGSHTLALDQEGRLWAWGLNAQGQLGIGGTTNAQRPTLVPLAGLTSGGIAVTSFNSVVAGDIHTLALDQEGRLWAWGWNGHGRLGIGASAQQNRPILVSLGGLIAGGIPVASFTSVAAGGSHTLALDQEGRLWAWGHGWFGQLGIGGTANQNRPIFVPFAGLTAGGIPVASFTSVAAGASHTLALDQEGRLWTWGENGFGRLGDGTTTNRERPVRITNIGAGSSMLPLAKELTAAEDADLPDEITFTFNLIPAVYEIDGIDSVSHSHTLSVQVTLDGESEVEIDDGVATITENINLWQLLADVDFDALTGVFVWNLQEQIGSSGITGMNYDNTRFQVRAWVDSDGELVHVLVYNLTVVEGEEVAGSKVEPGPLFENVFGTEGDLEISKTISGDFANLAIPFSFTLTLTEGPLAPVPATLTGQLYNHDNLPIPAPDGIIELSEGTNTFTLRHGERLFIQGLPAGTIFTVAKSASPQFQPQAVTTVPGVGAYTVTINQGDALTTASHAIVSANAPTTVVITNFYNWVPPTGLAIAGISTLPFILVIFLLMATIASRKRRAIETLPLA